MSGPSKALGCHLGHGLKAVQFYAFGRVDHHGGRPQQAAYIFQRSPLALAGHGQDPHIRFGQHGRIGYGQHVRMQAQARQIAGVFMPLVDGFGHSRVAYQQARPVSAAGQRVGQGRAPAASSVNSDGHDKTPSSSGRPRTEAVTRSPHRARKVSASAVPAAERRSSSRSSRERTLPGSSSAGPLLSRT